MFACGSAFGCLGGTKAVCRLGHEIVLDMAISQFAHTPKPHRGCTSAALVRRFASDGITYALTSAPLFRNSIARGGSLFRGSCFRNKQGCKRHNAVTPFATILQQGNHTCASNYNLPPSLREVPRRGGGSSCPPSPRVSHGSCAAARCAVRAWRTKELPLSAAIPCPQAAHYIGAAKRWRGDAATVG